MITLTEQEILSFNKKQIEENLLYTRYLLAREQKVTESEKFIQYIELLEKQKAKLEQKETSSDLSVAEIE
ncbi:hypothetical protein [Adhaeribacter aquaticus]|uniref:hypothetical protein n=1 Tax=Adhaeribacter aquaticus TaxID=299567 RepID=UPI00040A07E7|nr:hypothetical protein [Adhaeribacter aquaticus]